MDNSKGYNYLRKLTTAKTAPGETFATGEVVAYCDAPMVCIKQADGSRVWWRVDLCEFAEQQTINTDTAFRNEARAIKFSAYCPICGIPVGYNLHTHLKSHRGAING